MIEQSKQLLQDLKQIEDQTLEEAERAGGEHTEDRNVNLLNPQAIPADSADPPPTPMRTITAQVPVRLGSPDLLDSNDAQFLQFCQRKETIITNLTHMSKIRFANDKDK